MSGVGKKSTLNEQMKALRNHFAAIVSTVKHLKATVDELKKKCDDNVNSEVQEIVESQKMVDEIVVANSDAIKQIKQELLSMKSGDNTKEEIENIMVGEDTN